VVMIPLGWHWRIISCYLQLTEMGCVRMSLVTGTVLSFCAKGSRTILNKWQIMGSHSIRYCRQESELRLADRRP
jgi:hypothetical protein